MVKAQIVRDLLGGDLRQFVATAGGRLVSLLPFGQPAQRADESLGDVRATVTRLDAQQAQLVAGNRAEVARAGRDDKGGGEAQDDGPRVPAVLPANRAVDRDERWPHPQLAKVIVDGLKDSPLLNRQGWNLGTPVLFWDIPRHSRMLLIPHSLREIVKWLAYATFQDLVRQQGPICNLAERAVWRRVPDDEPGTEAPPYDAAELRKVNLVPGRGIAVGVLGAGTVGTANQPLDLKSLGIVLARQNRGAQLAARINLLGEHKGEIRPLADAQMHFANTRADEAVENVLDFIREWPSHRFPRLLMTLQAITEDVFTRYGMPAGNYKLYASAVETLFRPPMLTTLEEYGLPAPLSARLGQFIPLDTPAGQIDDVLDRLRSMPRVAGLSSFETEMLRDTIDNL